MNRSGFGPILLQNDGSGSHCLAIQHTIGLRQDDNFLRKLATSNQRPRLLAGPPHLSKRFDVRQALFYFFDQPIDRKRLRNQAMHARFFQ